MLRVFCVLLALCIVCYGEPFNPQEIDDQQQISMNSNPSFQRHSFALGVSFISGNRVIFYQDPAVSDATSRKLHGFDGNVLGIFGGIYRFNYRHALRYNFKLGFSRLSFYEHANKAYEEIEFFNGLKYGIDVGYEWIFYRGKNVFLNTLVGIEYGFSYYKKDITNVFMQEIAPQLGFGIGVQNHHQIEFVLSMPFFSRLKFEIQSFTFVVPRRFEHIRFGLNYFYRF